ncbi:MAG: hypothetical protein ABI855_11695 [Bacteroidota bacterium]
MYLLKEPEFCEQLARLLKAELFTADVIRKSFFGSSIKLTGIVESKIQIWTPPANLDATFTVTNLYSKVYRSETSLTGWAECDEEDIKKREVTLTETVYTFNVITRDHLKVSEERLRKSLWHYRSQLNANCLLVRSIKVDDLALSKIQEAVKRSGYCLALWDLVLKGG